MAAFGLHFGTCSGCVAVHKDGKTDVVANDLGDRVTPAVVAFTDHEVSVGAAAKQGIIRNAANTISHVKKLIGCKMGDASVKEFKSISSVNLVEVGGGPCCEVEHKGKTVRVTPADVMTRVYAKLLETAQSSAGSGNKSAVVAVPPGFSSTQRNIMSECARAAGFTVMRVISEPAAALMAFDLGQLDTQEDCKVLVYRLGGTSHSASVMEVCSGLYRTVSTVNDSTFGADIFTSVLKDFLATEFKRQTRCDISDNKRAQLKLKLGAERAKHALSTMISAQCAVESLYDGLDFHQNMSRARFESLIQPLTSKCLALMDQALAQAQADKQDIAKVIVCGGGAKPPILRRVISDHMAPATLLNSIPEDEIIALGAAKQAALLAGDDTPADVGQDQDVSFHFLPDSVCVKLCDSELEEVLPPRQLAPARRQHTHALPSHVTEATLELYSAPAGPTPTTDTATLLAKIVLKDLPAGATIKSNFHLKREGDLHVTCHEVTSDRQASVVIPAN